MARSLKRYHHEILNKLSLMDREEAIRNIHFPEDQGKLLKAQARLKFEELFFIQLSLLNDKLITAAKDQRFCFSSVGEKVNRFYKEKLPFELTEAQKKGYPGDPEGPWCRQADEPFASGRCWQRENPGGPDVDADRHR